MNDLAPGYVVLTYASPDGTHKQTIPVANPLFVLGAWVIDEKGTSGVLWTAAVDALLVVLKAMHANDSIFSGAELYTKAVGAAGVLVATYALAVTGTGSVAHVKAAEMSMSFKTAQGGRGKIVVLDTYAVPNGKFMPAGYSGLGGAAALGAYLVGNTSMVFGRDGHWPAILGKALTKTNDILRKKYNMS